MQSEATSRPNMRNPDAATVFTFSDSIVQRLPTDEAESPLRNEQRAQNIDDFWRERLDCLNNAFITELGATEAEFNRLEATLRTYAKPIQKNPCAERITQMMQCMDVNYRNPMVCEKYLKRMDLCINAVMAENAKRSLINEMKRKLEQIN